MAGETLQVNVSYSNSGARVLSPVGPMNIRTLFDFQAISRQEADKNVIIDLSGVPYMDSAALGSVLSVFTHCQNHGRRFAICGLSDRLMTLFKVTHVHTVLPNFATFEAAEAEVAKG
ncbi:MAG: STAS domain-containing protein [Bryobacteraceae bacterium]